MKSCFSYGQLLLNYSSLLSGATEQDLLSDFNHMLLGVFVVFTQDVTCR